MMNDAGNNDVNIHQGPVLFEGELALNPELNL